jgi:hypothetical protein
MMISPLKIPATAWRDVKPCNEATSLFDELITQSLERRLSGISVIFL